jgi:hypothetical protein
MWIPGGMVHGAAAILLLYKWVAREDGGRAAPMPTKYR